MEQEKNTPAPVRGDAFPDNPHSGVAREAAEALAHRCALAMLSFPVVVLTLMFVVPGARRRLAFYLVSLLLLVVLSGIRLKLLLPFERHYAKDPHEWRRNFRIGVAASALVWIVFSIHEMNAGDGSWQTWIMLLVTAGISAGATTSLCADPAFLRLYLISLLVPEVVWGAWRGGPEGTAIAVVVSVFLLFIEAQSWHNSRVFFRSAFDKQALREAGQQRDSLINTIDGIVWESDAQRSRFTFVSRRAESILEYPADAWISEPFFWANHIHPDDRDRAIGACPPNPNASGDYVLEYRMIASTGRTVWLRDIVSVTANPGGEVTLRGVMVDITERWQANQERTLLAQALRTVREAVGITNTENQILFVNDAFLKLYGYRREEILSKPISIVFSAQTPPELPAIIDAETERGGWQGEVRSRDKNGREFPIALSTALVRDELGRAVAHVGVGSDITGRKRGEEELRRAKEAAEAANRAKSEFLANMSHELRTPLNAIIGYSQLLQEEAADRGESGSLEDLRRIQKAGHHLLKLINDVLDLSKIEAGRMEVHVEEVPVTEMVGSVLPIVEALVRENGNRFEVKSAVQASMAADPIKFRQSLLNLLGNACKFTQNGSITLSVDRRELDRKEWIAWQVRDTGIGIGEADVPKLFAPFSQIDSSTTRKFDGTGLGLAISRRFCELMGGCITVDSEVGHGSTFTIYIPENLAPGAPCE